MGWKMRLRRRLGIEHKMPSHSLTAVPRKQSNGFITAVVLINAIVTALLAGKAWGVGTTLQPTLVKPVPGSIWTVVGGASSGTVYDVVVKGSVTLSSSVYDVNIRNFPVSQSATVVDAIIKGSVTLASTIYTVNVGNFPVSSSATVVDAIIKGSVTLASTIYTVNVGNFPVSSSATVVDCIIKSSPVLTFTWTGGKVPVSQAAGEVWAISGGGTPTKNQTWMIQTGFTPCTTSTKFIDFFNATGSGKIVRILQIGLQKDMSAITGVPLRFDLLRTTAVGTGAATAAVAIDLSNSALPAEITARIKPPAGATLSTLIVSRMYHSEETNVAAQIQEAHPYWPAMALYDGSGQILTLRENQGITLQQITTSIVGLYNVYILFTVE